VASDARYPPEDSDCRLLLLQWYRRVRQAQLAHAEAATVFGARSRWLGIPAVALSALVGTSVFVSLSEPAEPWLQILTGMVSVAAAVLAALQTFLRSSDVAAEHRMASRSFGALRRYIGQMGAIGHTARGDLVKAVEDIRQRYDEISAATPNVPPKIFDRYQLDARKYQPPEFDLWPEAERPPP
jgi:hypothetical protein